MQKRVKIYLRHKKFYKKFLLTWQDSLTLPTQHENTHNLPHKSQNYSRHGLNGIKNVTTQ